MNKAYRDFAPTIIKSQGGVSLSASDYHHYKEAKLRVYIIILCFILCYLIGMIRVVSLSLSDYKPRDYSSTYNKKLIDHRANITDRNGNLLATSLKIPSVYADPAKIIDLDEAVYKLHSVLKDIPLSVLRKKLQNSKRRFVWIKRKITPEIQYKINKLGIPGVFFKEEEKDSTLKVIICLSF